MRLLRDRRGVSEEWLEGARPLAEVIEDACIGVLDRPVPLEGKAANAMLQVLRLSYLDPAEPRGPADLRNELERLYS